MRSLTFATLALAALLLLPGASAGSLYEVEGKWFWGVQGTVGVSGLPGVAAQATIFLDEGVEYFRVTFDPLGRVYVQCLNGAGFLSVSGLSIPTESCDLELNGAFAVARASFPAVDLGQPPGQFGNYLGSLREAPRGTGSFRIA